MYARIIPCLDVDAGRVVKGVNFLELIDAGSPVEMAKFYNQQGADELVFLDITASSEKRETAVDLAHKTSEELFIPFTIGGGINSLQDARLILKGGADKISINTSAVENKNLISEISKEFGAQCVVVAIDARRIGTDGASQKMEQNQLSEGDATKYEVVIHGGRTPTGLDAIEWAAEAEALGAGEVLLTSMDRDGTKEGYDLDLTRQICEAVNVPVIASGGAGNLQHLVDAVEVGASAVLVASLFHFGEFTIEQAKQYMISQGVGVRI